MVGGGEAARSAGRLFRTWRAGEAVCEEREINEKEKEVLRSILIVYVFIQNGKAMQKNKITQFC